MTSTLFFSSAIMFRSSFVAPIPTGSTASSPRPVGPRSMNKTFNSPRISAPNSAKFAKNHDEGPKKSLSARNSSDDIVANADPRFVMHKNKSSASVNNQTPRYGSNWRRVTEPNESAFDGPRQELTTLKESAEILNAKLQSEKCVTIEENIGTAIGSNVGTKSKVVAVPPSSIEKNINPKPKGIFTDLINRLNFDQKIKSVHVFPKEYAQHAKISKIPVLTESLPLTPIDDHSYVNAKPCQPIDATAQVSKYHHFDTNVSSVDTSMQDCLDQTEQHQSSFHLNDSQKSLVNTSQASLCCDSGQIEPTIQHAQYRTEHANEYLSSHSNQESTTVALNELKQQLSATLCKEMTCPANMSNSNQTLRLPATSNFHLGTLLLSITFVGILSYYVASYFNVAKVIDNYHDAISTVTWPKSKAPSPPQTQQQGLFVSSSSFLRILLRIWRNILKNMFGLRL